MSAQLAWINYAEHTFLCFFRFISITAAFSSNCARDATIYWEHVRSSRSKEFNLNILLNIFSFVRQ